MRIGFRHGLVGAVGAVAVAALVASSSTSYARGSAIEPAWTGFANNAQHTAVAPASPQPLNSVHWQVTVDHKPPCCDDGPIAHYASPMITGANTVVVPVRLSSATV